MKPSRQSIGAAVALLLLGACGGDGTPIAPSPTRRNTNFRAVEAFSYTLVGTDRQTVLLEGINGSVRILGGPPESAVTITGEREVRSDSQLDADAQLQQLQVDIQDAGSEILVRTRQPPNADGRSYVVNYTLGVPTTVTLRVTNVNGNLDVVGMNGDMSAGVTNGRVEASVRMRSGGSVRLTTVNGEIALHLPRDTSADFSAQVGNGTITLTNLRLENEVRTAMSLRGTLGAGDGTVSLQTVNGAIRVDGTS